jgi:iron complex outermembrane receptor protein
MKLNPLYLAMSASLFASTNVLAQTQDQEKQGYALENVTVTGQALGRYAITDASSTTRSNVPVIEMSRSVQVIDQNFINDADVQTLEDAIKYVSGTAPRLRLGGVDTQYYVRGFREGDTYRNGKREMFEHRVNMHTVESVEVLKGPSSVRFGVNSPGGIVNYTTKTPQADRQRSIKLRLNEHGKKELIGDFTGAANESGDVLYRLVVAGEDSESFRDFSEQKSLTIAPSFTFLLGNKTRLITAYELHKTELPIDRGIPIGQLSDDSYTIADVPIERKFSEPSDKSIDDTQLFDVTLEHQFNGGWQGELSYSYQKWDSDWSDAQNYGFDIETGVVIRGRSGYVDKEQETHQISSLVHGDFDLANIQHKVTVGVDSSESNVTASWGEYQQATTEFNLYNPVYGEFPEVILGAESESESVDTRGIFASETAYLGDKLIANLAGRYDFYKYNLSEDGLLSSKKKEEALTWNAGLLYKIIPSASIYLSYATSYEPNSAKNLVGELKPQEGEQWEVGVKGLAMNDTLQYSVVFYDITKSNISKRLKELNDDGDRIYKLIGEQTSTGMELDTAWQMTDDVSLLASYAYIDAEISKDATNPLEVGNTPEGVAKHSASLFASYGFTPSLTILGGVNYADDVPNDEDNVFMLPGATVYDLSLKYSHFMVHDETVLLQAGIKNLTDERVYIQSGHDEVGIGQARTLYANLEYQF